MSYSIVVQSNECLHYLLEDMEKSSFITTGVLEKVKEFETFDILHRDVGDPFDSTLRCYPLSILVEFVVARDTIDPSCVQLLKCVEFMLRSLHLLPPHLLVLEKRQFFHYDILVLTGVCIILFH